MDWCLVVFKTANYCFNIDLCHRFGIVHLGHLFVVHCMEYSIFCLSFFLYWVSIWTPWRNIFSRLPKRIFSKIISVSGDKNVKAKMLVSQVWNSIIISMYREHLISLEHVQKLIYKQIDNPAVEGGSVLKEPIFFVSQEDQSIKSSMFQDQSEAQRRITFLHNHCLHLCQKSVLFI